MAARTKWQLRAVLVALVVVLSACGGDDGESAEPADSDQQSDSGGGGEEQVSDEPVTVGPEPITGPLVSVLSFEFGLYALDPDTGAETEVNVADAGFSDRDLPAVLTDDGESAYLIVYTLVEGQDFTSNVALAHIDLSTGVGTKLVELGQNRSDDESPDLTEFRAIGAGSSTAWVEQRLFGTNERSLIGFDRATGAESARIEAGVDQTIRNPVLVGDDLLAVVDGVVSVADSAGGWTAVLDLNELTLGTFLTTDQLDDFVVTESGAPLSADAAEFMLRVGRGGPTNSGWASGGGSLWWLFNDFTSGDDGGAIVGGVVQFDPVSGTVVDAWPVGVDVGEFGDDNTISTLSTATFDFVNGQLWFADGRESGNLYRLDPGSGVAAFEIPVGADVDYTEIEMLPTDSDALWLEVTDWVITSEEDGGRSSSGTSQFEKFDLDSGLSVLEVDESELTGF